MTIIIICVAAAAAVAITSIAYEIYRRREKQKSDANQKYSKNQVNHRKEKSLESYDNASTETVINYDHYNMTSTQRAKYIIITSAVLFAIGYLFFKNIYICFILCTLSFPYLRVKRKDLIKKRKDDLNSQFKDALYSVSTSLSSGKSVEASFKGVLGDLKILYSDESSYIIKEFELISRKIDMNETVESALIDFAQRANIEDITNFADVFLVCKSTGGNLVEVIKNTSNILNQKIEIKSDIELLITEQKFSQKILNIMPFGILVILTISSPDYIQPLYSAKGHFVMAIVLLLLGVAYFISSKIMNIKV